MESGLIILSVVFAILSGICKAVMDLSEESKIKGNPLFWHKNKSWQNKWKNGDKKQGEKFWLSSRQLVWITDAWHLFGVLFRISFAVAYTCIGMLTTVSYFYLFGVVVAYILFATAFHIFYTFKIFRK
jgi:hypothetical protein